MNCNKIRFGVIFGFVNTIQKHLNIDCFVKFYNNLYINIGLLLLSIKNLIFMLV